MLNIDEAQIRAERAVLDHLLNCWEVGDIGPWDVVNEAEALEEQALKQRERIITREGVTMLRDFEPHDPRSIGATVLELLVTAHGSYVLPEDIAVMRTFLQTPLGDEDTAWQMWDTYWNSIDYTARAAQVAALYFGTSE
ncbi:MAG: hypothetical protein M3R24_11440 [Chloroflexota bacterium]|nr:hypothetical protein [Chloroflexota bacterium]